MNNLKQILAPAYIVLCALLISSCTSVTKIQTYPDDARVYINDEYVGTTPYIHSDTRISGSTLFMTIEKDGYVPLNTVIVRNEEVDAGAIVGGIFAWPAFFWMLKYKPEHFYELMPVEYGAPDLVPYSPQVSKADELRELKKLMDEGVITQEEFEKEKARILKGD